MHILKYNLFISRKRIRLSDSSKRRNLSFTNFFKILKYYLFVIFTDHSDHFFNFFKTVMLINATKKEGYLFRRQISIIIEVDDIECLSDIIIRKQFTIDVIACSLRVEWIFSNYLSIVLFCIFSQEDRFDILIALRSIYFNCVFIF